MKVLLIEDDNLLNSTIKVFLQKNNITATIAPTGEISLFHLYNNTYDIIIVDLNLPDMPGEKIINIIRESKNNKLTPLIVLSAMSNIKNRTNTLLNGADMFLSKPCYSSELLAAIKSLNRRINYKNYEEKLICGNVILDNKNYEVSVNNITIPLTSKEYKIMHILMKNVNQIVHKDTFMFSLYDDASKPRMSKIVDVYVCKIRQKIKSLTGESCSFIKTTWGSGYKIVNNINSNIYTTKKIVKFMPC